MTLHYLSTALKSLRKNKFYSALSIGGFAVGFSICIIIGLYAYQEFTVDRGFDDSDRIYRIIEAKTNSSALFLSFTESLDGQLPEIEAAAPYNFGRSYQDMLFKTEYAEVSGIKSYMYTNEDYFKLFSLSVLQQNEEQLFIDKQSIVLSESLSKQLFGSENPLGKTIDAESNGRPFESYVVSAVVEDLPSNTSIPAQYYLGSEFHYNSIMVYNEGGKRKVYHFVGSCVKLYDGVDVSEFQVKLNEVKQAHMEDDSLVLQPLADVYLGSNGMKNSTAGNDVNNTKLIYVLLSIAILILILSIVNFINYSTVRYLGKLKVIAIRKANGASVKHIFKYDMAESCITLLLSLTLSAFLVYLLLPSTSILLGKAIDIRLLFTTIPTVIFSSLIILILFLTTIIPLWGLLKFNLAKHIKGEFSSHNTARTNLLTIFQFVIAIALLVSVFAINKQLYFVKNINLGYEKEHIVYTYLDDCNGQGAAVKNEFDKLPFVTQSSLSNGLPMRIGSTSTRTCKTADGRKKKIKVWTFKVDENFFDMYGININEGRNFSRYQKGNVRIVNKAVLDVLELDSLYEMTLENHLGSDEVIGVIDDFHFASYHNKIEPLVIRYVNPEDAHYFSIKLLSGDFAEQKKQMQEVWKEFSPEYPLDLKFVDEQIEAMYTREGHLSKSIAGLSIIAFLLVTLGILGQVFQITINKTKEIGIRKVNGASLFDVFRIINFRFVMWVLLAFVLAVPLSYYALQKWLENFAYKTPLSWWVFALAGLGTLVFVVGVVTLQSWKTARKNPVEALRYE